MEKYLECARVTTTHGVRGAVRLENRCDCPETLASLTRMYKKEGGCWKELTVLHASVQKSMVIASFREIPTMEDAIAMRDVILYADREDIPLEEGAHFIADLLGLPVLDDATGDKLGCVEDVICPAGQDIYVVKKEDGGTFMIPAVAAFIRAVSPEEGFIRVSLIEGMMD